VRWLALFALVLPPAVAIANSSYAKSSDKNGKIAFGRYLDDQG
jgi:hypothetical protein